MSTGKKAAIFCLVAALLVALTEVGASVFFVWVFGYGDLYPWPDRGWMWLRYLLEARDNAIVARWLVITAVVAGLPPLLIGCLMISRASKTQANLVYGKTDWATGRQRKSGGIASSRKPF